MRDRSHCLPWLQLCCRAWKGKWEPRVQPQTALHMAPLAALLPLHLARAVCWGIDQLVSSHMITALKREMDCKMDCKMCTLFSHMEKNNACVYPLTAKKVHSILMEQLNPSELTLPEFQSYL